MLDDDGLLGREPWEFVGGYHVSEEETIVIFRAEVHLLYNSKKTY